MNALHMLYARKVRIALAGCETRKVFELVLFEGSH